MFGLVVIFTSCILFSLSWFSNFAAQTELKRIQSFFRYMQQKAITQKQDIKVILDVEKNWFKETDVTGNETFELQEHMRFKVCPGIQGPPSSPIYAVTKPITFPNNEVIFYKTGVLSSGTMYLLDTQSNTQYALSNAVSSISFVRLYQYANETWIPID